ncbi:hypothetical protein NQ315_012846, partial [Exocentrus adspersus]
NCQNNNNQNRILRAFDNNPRLSSRRAAHQLQISKSQILRTLRNNHKHAYHLQPVHHLHPGDPEQRVRFCQWLLNSTQENPDFLRKILWTDESTFTRRGITNYHNIHIWAGENPREIRPRSFQTEFSVNVWLGIFHDNVCGPHFLPPRSPDLNPLDFYVWGYLKDKVYATPVLTRDDLVQRIQEACNEMRQNPNQVSDAVNSLIRRCHKCIEVGRQHFEQLRIHNTKSKGQHNTG